MNEKKKKERVYPAQLPRGAYEIDTVELFGRYAKKHNLLFPNPREKSKET